MNPFQNISGVKVFSTPGELSTLVIKEEANYNLLKANLCYSTWDHNALGSIMKNVGIVYINEFDTDSDYIAIQPAGLYIDLPFQKCAFPKEFPVLLAYETLLENTKLKILSFKDTIELHAPKVWSEVLSIIEMFKNIPKGFSGLTGTLIEKLTDTLEKIQDVLKAAVKKLGATGYSITIGVPPSITLEFSV